MIINEYVRFSGYHYPKLWFYGRLAAVEMDSIVTDQTGIGAVYIAMELNDRKEPYQCIKNRNTIRLLYSTLTKWTVTYFVPVNFAFHDDDTVTWNNNLYGKNHAKDVSFYWIRNAILIIRFNASCMYVLSNDKYQRVMNSIKY